MSKKPLSREAFKIASLCVAWYTFSASNNVLGKRIFMVFPYPLTLSMTHHLALFALMGPALVFLKVPPTPSISRRFYIRRFVPLALGKLLTSFSSHLSILKVPVSYSHTVKAMMPIFTVILTTLILREKYSLKVYLSLVPIVTGVLIATVTELSFDSMGLVAALVATLTFALQNIYSKKCMKDTHIHHLRLLFSLSQLACVILLPIWLCTDLWDLVTNLHKVEDLGWLALVLPFNGFLIVAQNIVAFSMISAVSPVSFSVASSTKRIVVITASLLLLKNPVTSWNMCGMGLAIGGVACYNKVKLDEKKKPNILPVAYENGISYSSIIPTSPSDIGLTGISLGTPHTSSNNHAISHRPLTGQGAKEEGYDAGTFGYSNAVLEVPPHDSAKLNQRLPSTGYNQETLHRSQVARTIV